MTSIRWIALASASPTATAASIAAGVVAWPLVGSLAPLLAPLSVFFFPMLVGAGVALVVSKKFFARTDATIIMSLAFQIVLVFLTQVYAASLLDPAL